ncbi:hypothetical protein RHGRI_006626 [Rhododendron griersonianum]|uniref:ATP-dependent DNA helicase n=1 Tax=Rhododendron griersonianum TaxID=479676 RepID=A0AAV6KUA3_9ERIC|nr:hypothetical protein RHGRI_006626 [Rhododendron griersonianum]
MIMSTSKKPRISYSQLSQETKDNRNKRRRELRLQKKLEKLETLPWKQTREIPTQAFVLRDVKSCDYCQAKRFPSEPDGFCCSKGQVRLYSVNVPDDLLELYCGQSGHSQHFRQYIRPFNNCFAFTSFGVTLDPRFAKSNNGIYTFRAQGQAYHAIRSLYPPPDKNDKNKYATPSFLQLYFFDTDNEVSNRNKGASELDPNVISRVIDILAPNPYSIFFRSLRQIPETELATHQIKIRADPKLDTGTLGGPTASQVASFLAGETEGNSDLRERDILVYQHNGISQRIRYYFGCYDPLQYPLLFPFGEPGWHQGIKRILPANSDKSYTGQRAVLPQYSVTGDELLAAESLVYEENCSKGGMVSAREFYAYRFQIRPTTNSIILESGRLLQQFCVDMYIKIETSRLDYFRTHQNEIRADLYQGIVDSIARGESRGSKVGKHIVLPGSFIGGPRDMRKRYLDAMNLVERYGKPDIFLTMTCNPKWCEILSELKPHEDAQNRPDLVTRVFKSKLEELKKEVIKKQLFGPVAAYTYVIEFQKRGLPHVHLLLVLKKGFKLNSAAKFDEFISAEIPDKDKYPHLYAMVIRHMMHGPCGELNGANVCMKKGKCKNHYPRQFAEETLLATDGYPIYRRRADNKQVKVRGHMLDNKWVVPYNPYLLAKFDCHINVEICSTIKAVKYLYKYMYKGHDKVVFRILAQKNNEDHDEISEFQSARWVSPPEAMWRIFRFGLHEMHPAVISLHLHLENRQPVSFKKTTKLDNITDSDFYSRTMLTEFFYMNTHDKYAKSKKLLYKDFPSEFVWVTRSKTWEKRKQGNVVGRIITANPTEGERYYLRLLLNHVRGPTSFLHLRTVDGHIYDTYEEAGLAFGLLKDDKGNEKCLEEACMYQMPKSLRQLYCTLLVHCACLNPKELFCKFEDQLTEDFRRQNMSKDEARQCLLGALNSMLESMGKKLEHYGLHDFMTDRMEAYRVCKEIEDEKNLDISEKDLLGVSKLNIEQLAAFNEILQAVREKKAVSFFLDGPGGTGKTFLYRTILATVRSTNKIALATATSGVAASILPNGRTAHSRFKIPLDGDGNLCCNVGKQTGLASLLNAAVLIIWDEASMAKRESIEAVDRMLRDITEVDLLFGGKVVVLGGDFRQVLPVIPKGTRQDCIDASLVRSTIWPCLKKFKLTQNMRAKTDPSFSDFLLRVGNGLEPENLKGQIAIPASMTLSPNAIQTPVQQLIDFVFPDLHNYLRQPLSMTDCAILTPKNDSVDIINEQLINNFPGKEYSYVSVDDTVNKADQALYVDFLHSVNPPGLPSHILSLKENCPVMLLRNLNASKGMCNGTRLICRKFEKHVIIAQIAVGEHKGDFVFIPRIPLRPSDPKLYPVEFTRKQFPIRLCFAMTINKAQGQTLDIVGIDLHEPVFSHGQLYVALSRATASEKIKILIGPSDYEKNTLPCTKNIVFPEILAEAQSNEAAIIEDICDL